MIVRMYVFCTTCMPGAYGGQKKVLGPRKLDCRWLWACTCVLGSESGSSARVASVVTAESPLLSPSVYFKSF